MCYYLDYNPHKVEGYFKKNFFIIKINKTMNKIIKLQEEFVFQTLAMAPSFEEVEAMNDCIVDQLCIQIFEDQRKN